MIAITKYDTSMEREPDRMSIYDSRPIGDRREPVATINLQVVASGADLDKFMAMLETLTGQTHRRPGTSGDDGGERALGVGLVRR